MLLCIKLSYVKVRKGTEYYQKALEIRKQVLGAKHLDTKNVQENIEIIIQKMNEEK